MRRFFIPHVVILAFGSAALLLSSCDKQKTQEPGNGALTLTDPISAEQETPLLPVNIGDTWRYKVHVEIPAGASAVDSPATDTTYNRFRTYLGKLIPGPGKPEVDCFEIEVPGASSIERELVEITDDRIMMRGSIIVADGVPGKPMWLEPAVPFITAGIRVGSSMPELTVSKGTRTRTTAVVGREEVKVPAGTFKSIRLLMSGTDGPLEMRRTIWFAPGVGIVRESNVRYSGDKLVLRETQELIETTVKH